MNRERPSAILDAGITVASGPILVFSLFLLAAGHNQPGGGFAGGLVAGVAILLAWAGGGTELVRRIVPLRSSALMGTGLLISTVTALIPLTLDLGFLESGSAEIALPAIGEIKLVSAVLFDIGVYLVVVGMSLGLVRALGEIGPADRGAIVNLITLTVVSVLFGAGTFLLLQRSLAKIIIGLGLISHGANLFIMLSSTGSGGPPVLAEGVDAASVADPLPQAMVLTAIVITFGVTAFLLALALRSYLLTGSDEVEDDLEDRRIGRHEVEHT